LAGRFYLYLGALFFGLIGLANEGQTLSGIYQQLKAFRARGEVEKPDPDGTVERIPK
jgi:hypothetical protein